MLQHIHVKNFTIIKDLELDLPQGMTVLTGETGSGKSIVIDAIELALGQRANADLIRPGTKRAEITLAFDIQKIPSAKEWLEQHDLYEEEECLIRRTIHSDGRSKSFINTTPMTLASLRELGELLINIHGQHGFQTLLKPEQQMILLDTFANHQDSIRTLNKTYYAWQNKYQEYKTLLADSKQAKEKANYLSYQLQELQELALNPEELPELEQEQKELAHAETLLAQTQSALNFLSEEDHAALEQLTQASAQLEKIQLINPKFSEITELVNNAIIQTEEASHELQHYLTSTTVDPQRLQFVEARLSKAYELARKHQVPLEELPQLQEQMQAEHDKLENYDEYLSKLQQESKTLESQYQTQAAKLSKSRAQAAGKLSKAVSNHFQSLGMPEGRFQVELVKKEPEGIYLNGLEKVRLLVTVNPGQPLQPLSKVASGGELSRISLAIQLITTQQSNTPTLVFDEVDVGIGGATADTVGVLLRQLADNAQVICITHLAQVAAKGHQHIKVEKTVENQQTISSLRLLNTESRIQEIARMAGGSKITEQTLAHAKEMLELDVCQE